MTALDRWQRLIDGIWQEQYAVWVVEMLQRRIDRIRALKAAGVKPTRVGGKIRVPK